MNRNSPTPLARDPAELFRRVTYLMLFRVVVTTLLLGAAIAAGLAVPNGRLPIDDLAERSGHADVLFIAVGVTYALTLIWAALLRPVRKSYVAAQRLAVAQVGCDLAAVTLLVHFTGGAESEFAFLYLLVIVGASTVVSRATLVVAGVATALYVAVAIVDRIGLLPGWQSGVSETHTPLSVLMRTLAINIVALLATAALASRLSVELRRAGENLAAQGARLLDLATLHDDMVRSLSSGLITLSDDARIQSVNPAGEEILELGAAEAFGRPIEDLWPGFEAACSDGASAAPLHRTELTVKKLDGEERIVGLSVSPLFSAQRVLIGRVVNFQDLTDLRRMQQQVERTAHLAVIGRLAAGVAHEIRNPLAAISGSIEMLRSASDAEGADRELWEIVGREIDRLNAQITDLLEYARPRAPEIERLDVASMIAELLRVFHNDRRLAGDRVSLLPVAGPLWTDADPNQLRQVLWNLLRNAAEASPGGEPIAISADVDGEWVRITVRDRGPGIAEQDRAGLFEPFASTKLGGTGLGLATVHRIVHEHGGHVEIGNADGGGALATVRLPRKESPRA